VHGGAGGHRVQQPGREDGLAARWPAEEAHLLG
jgi:hypothetical protein